MPIPLRPRLSRNGFSLVEVVMALSMFAFALVGIMGLMPVALQTHMDAKFDTLRAQIHQRLAAEALATDFAKLDELNGSLRYFDEEGKEVSDPQAGTSSRPIIFTAKIVVTTVSLPSAYDPASLKKVLFYVVHDPARRGIPASVQPTDSLLIAKTAPAP